MRTREEERYFNYVYDYAENAYGKNIQVVSNALLLRGYSIYPVFIGNDLQKWCFLSENTTSTHKQSH